MFPVNGQSNLNTPKMRLRPELAVEGSLSGLVITSYGRRANAAQQIRNIYIVQLY